MIQAGSWQCTSTRDAGADAKNGWIHWVPVPGLVQVDALVQDYTARTVLRLSHSDDRISPDGQWIGFQRSGATMNLRPSGMGTRQR
jgi:hypothetical protein